MQRRDVDPSHVNEFQKLRKGFILSEVEMKLLETITTRSNALKFHAQIRT